MKKIIVVVVVLAVLGGAYGILRSQRSLLEEPGKVAAAEYGHITLPITASCVAKEPHRVDILPEASGPILKIPVSEGEMVKKGDLLVLIDKVDEQRAYNQQKLAVDSAKANVKRLRLRAEYLEKDLPNSIKRAEAALDAARQKRDFAELEFNRVKKLYNEDHETDREFERAKTQWMDALASEASAAKSLDTAKLGSLEVEIAWAEVEVAQTDLATQEERLKDSEKRLEETEIRSPIDGRVVRIMASEGLVATSATRSFSIASPLMQLVDTSELEVEAQVDEADIDRVTELWHTGRLARENDENPQTDADDRAPTSPEELAPDQVFVEFDALRGQQFTGRVVDIAQEPKDIANIITYDVRVVLDKCEDLRRIRLGMQGTVEFRPKHAEGLCIPYAAVHRSSPNEFVVFVPADDALREEREVPVEVGLSDGVKVVVNGGLSEGDKVYTKRPTRIDRNRGEEG
jgi:HlyD family secretion protein